VMQSGQRKCMVGRGSGWDDAVMDAGMRNRGRFPVKTPTHQPDSCARSPGRQVLPVACLSVRTQVFEL
jgi:hypothetical protein